MKIACSLAFVALTAAAFPAHAQDEAGRVRGLYVEVARGVLVDPRLARSGATRRWVDVELGVPGGERRRALVMVPDDMKVALGDLVGVKLEPADRRIAALQPFPSVSRVTRVESGSQLAGPAN